MVALLAPLAHHGQLPTRHPALQRMIALVELYFRELAGAPHRQQAVNRAGFSALGALLIPVPFCPFLPLTLPFRVSALVIYNWGSITLSPPGPAVILRNFTPEALWCGCCGEERLWCFWLRINRRGGLWVE
tara:strand:- start:11498 stop:11890 length:393 start_codon:yes stop_codon:yes gene_type:complete